MGVFSHSKDGSGETGREAKGFVGGSVGKYEFSQCLWVLWVSRDLGQFSRWRIVEERYEVTEGSGGRRTCRSFSHAETEGYLSGLFGVERTGG
jgi:hypothetical protein